MSNETIVIPDYDYLADGHTIVLTANERASAPPADEIMAKAREWRTLADVDHDNATELCAQLNQLRRELCAAQSERDVYRRALRLYGNANNWAHNPASGGDDLDVFLPTLNGYTPAQDALAQFATTALSG